MLLRFVRRPVLIALVAGAMVSGVVGPWAGSAAAHNTLISSDPADGATLTTAPTTITWEFDQAVPLDTMTVTLIDAAGVRSDLPGSTHGSSGETEVVTPLPPLGAGSVTVRWRLVGPDGHVITGRVEFTVVGTPTDTSALPGTTLPPPADEATVGDEADEVSTPSALRWLLRYGSYAAIMAVVGILLTSAFVWADAGNHPLLRRVLAGGLLATAALAMVQLLVVASDVSGAAPWSSLGSLDAATTTDAGMALLVRVFLAVAMWVVLFRCRIVHTDVYWTAVSLPGLGLLATWAFAGHAASMRWPVAGVVTDVAHHAAAAAWVAGLAIVGWVVIPTAAPAVLVPTVRRFSRVAAVCVAVLVVTGIVQTVRLVGSPLDLFAVDHGRYLVAKLVALAAMLVLANVNRRRIETRLGTVDEAPSQLVGLRRAVMAEFGIGMVIVGITAAMVVSPPATSATADVETATPVNYMM